MNNRGMRRLGPFLASVSWIVSVPAFAQDNSVPPPAQTEELEAGATNEIVVTARRKGERLMDVPVVVSVLSSETITRYQSNNLSAIGELTPTVIVGAYKSDGGSSIAIRGISSPANQVGFEQAVSVAIDGVQTSNGQIAQLGFFDVDRVEVLKGPQALFFGKNNTAGVISVASALPTDRFQGNVRTSYEFVGDEATVEGYLSGPLTDTLSGRLAVRYRNLDGWVRNTATAQPNPFYRAATGAPVSTSQLPGTSNPRPGDEELVGRATLLYKPTTDFTATLRVLADRATDSGPGASTQNIGPCVGANPRFNGIPDLSADCVADNRVTFGDIPQAIRDTMYDGGLDKNTGGKFDAIVSSLSLQAKVGNINIASTTGYNKVNYKFITGFDQTSFSTFAQFYGQKIREFSQDLRLSTNYSGPLNFVGGAYYQHSNLKVRNDTKLSDASYNPTANRYTSFAAVGEQAGNTYSVFGQGILKFLSHVELAGGLRWTREEKSYQKQSLYAVAPFLSATGILPGSAVPGTLTGKYSENNVSPEVTLTWTPDSNHTLFAAYRTGFKAGGFGLTNPLQSATVIGDVDFGSEKAHGFEAGGRLIGLNGRLNISVAAFAYQFKSLQVNTYDPVRVAFTINNAGAVRQRGLEMEGNFRATKNVTLRGAVAYVDNKFQDFVGQCYGYAFPAGADRTTAVAPPNCSFANNTSLALQQNFNGRRPARSPGLSGNAGATLSFDIGDSKLSLNGDSYYSSGYYAAETMASSTYQRNYWRFNAGATFSPAGDRWTIGLLGRNLTNKYYLLYAVDRTGGLGVPGNVGEQRGVVARGREVVLQASMNF